MCAHLTGVNANTGRARSLPLPRTLRWWHCSSRVRVTKAPAAQATPHQCCTLTLVSARVGAARRPHAAPQTRQQQAGGCNWPALQQACTTDTPKHHTLGSRGPAAMPPARNHIRDALVIIKAHGPADGCPSTPRAPPRFCSSRTCARRPCRSLGSRAARRAGNTPNIAQTPPAGGGTPPKRGKSGGDRQARAGHAVNGCL